MLSEHDSSVAPSTGATADDVKHQDNGGSGAEKMTSNKLIESERNSSVEGIDGDHSTNTNPTVTQQNSVSELRSPTTTAFNQYEKLQTTGSGHESILVLSAKEVYFKARAHTQLHPVKRQSTAFTHYTCEQRKLFRENGVMFEGSDGEHEVHASKVGRGKAELRKSNADSVSGAMASIIATNYDSSADETLLEARSRSHLLGRGLDRSELIDTSGYKPPVQPSREEYHGAAEYKPFSSPAYHKNQSRQLRLRAEKTVAPLGSSATSDEAAAAPEVAPDSAEVSSTSQRVREMRSADTFAVPTSAAEAEGIARWRALSVGQATPEAVPPAQIKAKKTPLSSEASKPTAAPKTGLIIKDKAPASGLAAPKTRTASSKSASPSKATVPAARLISSKKTSASQSATQDSPLQLKRIDGRVKAESASESKITLVPKSITKAPQSVSNAQPSTPDTRPKVWLIIKKRKADSADESSVTAGRSSQSEQSSQTGDLASTGSVSEGRLQKKAKMSASATETPSPKAISGRYSHQSATREGVATTETVSSADEITPLRRSGRKRGAP